MQAHFELLFLRRLLLDRPLFIHGQSCLCVVGLRLLKEDLLSGVLSGDQVWGQIRGVSEFNILRESRGEVLVN